MAFQEFSKNYLNILMVQLFQQIISFVFLSAGVFPMVFTLYLNDSESAMLSLRSSL